MDWHTECFFAGGCLNSYVIFNWRRPKPPDDRTLLTLEMSLDPQWLPRPFLSPMTILTFFPLKKSFG